MGKKIIIIASILVGLAAIGTGAFFIIKHISDENHKKDIEMAADCARTFEDPHSGVSWDSSRGGFIDTGAYEKYNNNRNSKRQECSEKYHVTHQEIIDKIGDENYSPR